MKLAALSRTPAAPTRRTELVRIAGVLRARLLSLEAAYIERREPGICESVAAEMFHREVADAVAAMEGHEHAETGRHAA